MKAVCKHCGSDDLYREVEVTIDGSRSIEVKLKPDGSVDVREGHTEVDHLHDGFEDPGNYACADCDQRAGKIEDLVIPESALANGVCCCGHPAASHRQATRPSGRRACTERACGCWDFETDPELATVVREVAA